MEDFSIMALHAKPDDAKAEIEGLFSELNKLPSDWTDVCCFINDRMLLHNVLMLHTKIPGSPATSFDVHQHFLVEHFLPNLFVSFRLLNLWQKGRRTDGILGPTM